MTSIHRAVDACRNGDNPALVARMPSGWAVMGAQQFLPGYCLLLPDPVVENLNALDVKERQEFLADMAALGDAVLVATNAARINYAILGNLDPALHAHVVPRYATEAEQMKTLHPWAYDWASAPKFDESEHGTLMEAIRVQLATDREP